MYTTLISPIELSSHLNDKNWLIVDCRFNLKDTTFGRKTYESAHIPGAIYAHMDDDLSGTIIPGTTGRHPLPTVAEAVALFSLWGIDKNVQVITYDDKGGALAARLWWMLRWLGHEAVAVLDGGWPAWTAADLPISNSIEQIRPRQFEATIQAHLLVDAVQVESMRKDPNYAVVDSRAAVRYRGEEEPIDPIAGHIPGAINLPFPENLQAGTFMDKNKLEARFSEVLADKTAEQVVFYCGSGVTACHNLLALMHAGLGEAKLYPGSWSEWITDETRAIASA